MGKSSEDMTPDIKIWDAVKRQYEPFPFDPLPDEDLSTAALRSAQRIIYRNVSIGDTIYADELEDEDDG